MLKSDASLLFQNYHLIEKVVILGSIGFIGHACCPSAVFTEGAQRRVWTPSNPFKFVWTHWIPSKAGDNLEQGHIIKYIICLLFGHSCMFDFSLYGHAHSGITYINGTRNQSQTPNGLYMIHYHSKVCGW